MKRAHLFILTTLHDHLHRLVHPRDAHIAKATYLLMARELVRIRLVIQHHPLASWMEHLEKHMTDRRELNEILSYVWVYDDIRGKSFKADVAKVENLLRRVTENFGEDWKTETDTYLAKEYLINTLYEVRNFYDAPVMMATTADLLKFRVWFGGALDADEDCYIRLYENVADMAEWGMLVEQYPDEKYMWRHDHEPMYVGMIRTFNKDPELYWKNISIMDYAKLREKAERRLLSEGYETCELFIAMP